MEFPSAQAEFEDESALGIFDEEQELQLAANLLEVVNEGQLDRFLADIIHEAGNVTGRVVAPLHAQAIRDVLANSIHQILPTASMDHGVSPQRPVGTELGNGLSSIAGQVLGLELEGLSPEDREFEAVRQFVRFAGETVKKTVEGSSGTDPHGEAQRAAIEAADVYAPGLFPAAPSVPGESGHWISCHGRIILFGA